MRLDLRAFELERGLEGLEGGTVSVHAGLVCVPPGTHVEVAAKAPTHVNICPCRDIETAADSISTGKI